MSRAASERARRRRGERALRTANASRRRKGTASARRRAIPSAETGREWSRGISLWVSIAVSFPPWKRKNRTPKGTVRRESRSLRRHYPDQVQRVARGKARALSESTPGGIGKSYARRSGDV